VPRGKRVPFDERDEYDFFVSSKLEEQNKSCAICHRAFSDELPPVQDHNHAGSCGKKRYCENCRRGLLCSACNFAIGALQESVESLASAIVYIELYRNFDGSKCLGVKRKLSFDEAEQVRLLWKLGTQEGPFRREYGRSELIKRIALEYGIGVSAVRNIVSRRTFKGV